MSKLDRRIAELERRQNSEMVFVTYIGNPEPHRLWNGDSTVSRQVNESWPQFLDRISSISRQNLLLIGDFGSFI